MTAHPKGQPAREFLYRLYDKAGGLLYVGITSDPAQRHHQHSRSKSWWSEVASSEVVE